MTKIRPIRSDGDHAAALVQIESLWGADPDSDAGQTLEVLITLVDAYEARHHEIAAPSPIDAVLFRMEQFGLARKDLEPFIGSRARVSEVLNGRRGLTLAMIRRLRDGLGISADVLVAESEASAA